MSYQTIGIVGAMVEEVELLHQQASDVREINKAGITFYEGKLHGKRIVFAKSGVGKVNAAVCTQIMIDLGADCILFTGVAGALDPALDVGDIVISSSSVQHDIDVTPLGFARGVVPYQEVSEYNADARLIQLAEEAGSRLFPGRCRTGKVLSGDQFVASRETVKELYEVFGGSCTEMEGAALAQVCAMNSIPYLVIRSMSDKADGSAAVSFTEFTIQAADNSSRMIDAIIANLS
ncbi:5'-methylthioadenosine/adenosylhomocysteine nucleosidase [Paenibacillaceae bacterium]|nr:5'-methylthioadenosine/adenosylhomocysteine nucleosidase [Paenibacillaceae bacterium]